MATCMFCETVFADPIQPADRQKIFELFDVSFKGRKLMHDGRICSRCLIQVFMIENAVKLKSEMNRCLAEKLNVKYNEENVPPQNGSSTAPVLKEEVKTERQEASVISEPSPVSSSTESVEKPLSAFDGFMSSYMCINCGQGFDSSEKLTLHSIACAGSEPEVNSCNRCGQALKYMTADARQKHFIQCNGQVRRGRPSTGIFTCPKCNLSLKNRMSHDRLNHIQRCTGSGLKRGRPSLKSEVKYSCPTCTKTFWTKDQLDTHVVKCDGNLTERRGRKPGDNHCLVCGQDVHYRHILKKHLKSEHQIDYKILNAESVSELPAHLPYSKDLLEQIMIQLGTNVPTTDVLHINGDKHADYLSPYPSPPSDSNNGVGHRKKARPQKIVPDDLFICATCNKRFEYRSSYESHCCFKLMDSQHLSPAASENTDDVAASSRAIPRPGVKGAALAQVIDDLLGANQSKDMKLEPPSAIVTGLA